MFLTISHVKCTHLQRTHTDADQSTLCKMIQVLVDFYFFCYCFFSFISLIHFGSVLFAQLSYKLKPKNEKEYTKHKLEHLTIVKKFLCLCSIFLQIQWIFKKTQKTNRKRNFYLTIFRKANIGYTLYPLPRLKYSFCLRFFSLNIKRQKSKKMSRFFHFQHFNYLIRAGVQSIYTNNIDRFSFIRLWNENIHWPMKNWIK